MKRMVHFLMFIIAALGLTSCGIVGRNISSVERSADQSKFKENFSIGTIIEDHAELLIDGPRALSGMEAGPREPFVQRHETMTIQIDDAVKRVITIAVRKVGDWVCGCICSACADNRCAAIVQRFFNIGLDRIQQHSDIILIYLDGHRFVALHKGLAWPGFHAT